MVQSQKLSLFLAAGQRKGSKNTLYDACSEPNTIQKKLVASWLAEGALAETKQMNANVAIFGRCIVNC